MHVRVYFLEERKIWKICIKNAKRDSIDLVDLQILIELFFSHIFYDNTNVRY